MLHAKLSRPVGTGSLIHVTSFSRQAGDVPAYTGEFGLASRRFDLAFQLSSRAPLSHDYRWRFRIRVRDSDNYRAAGEIPKQPRVSTLEGIPNCRIFPDHDD